MWNWQRGVLGRVLVVEVAQEGCEGAGDTSNLGCGAGNAGEVRMTVRARFGGVNVRA